MVQNANFTKLADILGGVRILEEVESKINGKVRVIKDLAWGTYIQVDGLTQSGGVVETIWRNTLRKIRNTKYEIRNVLILGLGGGTVARLIRKNWPNSKITGVDIDPVMVGMGKKYLGLEEVGLNIEVADAENSIRRYEIRNTKYDLILIDLYVGRYYPKKFESDRFLKSVRGLLLDGKFVVFNRLYTDRKRKEAVKFGEKLKKIFSSVEFFYPLANVMLLCRN